MTKREKGKTILTKYRLQSIVRDICPDTRTSYCMRRQVAKTTSVHKHEEHKKAKYTGLMTCGSRWLCPICSIKKNSQDAREIKLLLDTLDCDMYLITYTIQHTRKDRLKTLMDDLNQSIAYMRSGAKRKRFDAQFGVIGFIRALEIRWSDRAGFHPHVHELLLCRPCKTDLKHDIKKSIMLGNSYVKKLSEKGYYTNSFTVDARSSQDTSKGNTLNDYLTKCSIELEMTMSDNKKSTYSLSPFQLLDAFSQTGEVMYRDAFRVLRLDTARRQQIRWSKGLKKLLPPSVEEEEKENLDQWRLLAKLDSEQWKIICSKGLRGSLLKMARDCEHDADFMIWLSHAIYGQISREENITLSSLVA